MSTYRYRSLTKTIVLIFSKKIMSLSIMPSTRGRSHPAGGGPQLAAMRPVGAGPQGKGVTLIGVGPYRNRIMLVLGSISEV